MCAFINTIVELTSKIFLRDLKLLGYEMADKTSYNKEMIPFTSEELEAHESATKCFLCDNSFFFVLKYCIQCLCFVTHAYT